MAPDAGRVLRLNQAMLGELLADAPLEFTPAARLTQRVITILMPDGSLQRFRIEESPILSAAVAAQVPHWKSYAGRGIDDPSAVARFSWSNAGFSAAVLGSRGGSYVETATKGDREHYVVYHRDDLKAESRAFHCGVDEYFERTATRPSAGATSQARPAATLNFTNGANLRTYRLAVATTGEYTQAIGDQDKAFTDVMNAVNRMNLVFQRDVSVRFTLVSDKNLVFPDPATDPYDNTDSEAQLDINQTTIDNALTPAGYDIGHLFGTGGGGVAFAPSVCSEIKAKGYSARVPPTGDAFWVDYVAHEIGHQFSASHTYNTLETGTCSTRSQQNAYEVASGATIMSYVGICGDRNLQQFAVDNFHVQSLTQMLAEIARAEGGGSCGTPTATNNTPPTANAGGNFTIPKQTPFTLTASGTDANSNALTYSWEQYDLAASASGPNGTPAGTYDIDSDGVLRPLFRVYAPVTSPSRTYPSLPYILNNANQPPLTYTGTSPVGTVCEEGKTCVTGETLPAVARTLNFRVVVRDNNGGTADAGMQVNVDGQSGPFVVTAPNAAGTQPGGQQITVTWDVANTTAAPVNAANVRILLSTDGGNTFPNVLANSTANDGSEPVTLSNVATTTARIKIEAVGNIFFDISDADFTITATANPPAVQFDSANVTVKEDTGEAKLTVKRTGDTSGTTTVNYATADGTAKAGQDYTAESGQVTFAPNETSKEITIPVSNDPSDEPAETFGVTVNTPAPEGRGSSGSQTAAAESSTVNVTIEDDDPTPSGLANISTRLKVETGDNALIGGIIVTGNEQKKLIVRAIGPSANVPGALDNPQLQLFRGDEMLAENDNWEDAPNRQEIIDSTVAPGNQLESAILITVAPGEYTAIVRGVNNTTGIALVEAYDLDRGANSRFGNIATRGFLQGGDSTMIGGLIILGETQQRVIIRAIGPSTGVAGNLADPTLDLVNADGVVLRSNNNWKDSQEDEIRGTTIPPNDDRESAIVETLAPGSYTAVVRGVDDTTGIAVVEVYALQ